MRLNYETQIIIIMLGETFLGAVCFRDRKLVVERTVK